LQNTGHLGLFGAAHRKKRQNLITVSQTGPRRPYHIIEQAIESFAGGEKLFRSVCPELGDGLFANAFR
jgi:hypothetical protein